MKLSIVIPAYNEAARISRTLRRVEEYISSKDCDYEIIVVDDGSKDTTVRVVGQSIKDTSRLRVLENKVNRGKGFSVKRGMLFATGDLVLFSDADLSTPISELDKFLPLISESSVVIGSRTLRDSDVKKHQPFYREFMGKSFAFIVSVLALRGVSDTQCGFKLFRREVVKDIFSRQSLERWGFDVEILFLAKKLGYSIKEVPVVWVNSEDTKLNPVKDSIDMFFDLLRINWRNFRGGYE